MSGTGEKQSLLGKAPAASAAPPVGSEPSATSWAEDLRRNQHLCVVLSLLVACLGLAVTLVSFDALELKDLHTRRDGANLALLAGQGLVAINDEIVQRVNGNLTYASPTVTSIISSLVSTDLTNATLRAQLVILLETARDASALNFPVLLGSYNNVASQVLLLAYAAVARSAVPSTNAHLGFLCLGSHVQRLAAPLHYMSDFVRPSWGADQYRSFLGSLDDEPCGEFLPETMLLEEEWELLHSAPGLIGAPNPSVYATITLSRNAPDLIARGEAWSALFLQLGEKSIHAFDEDIMHARVALASSSAACVLVLCMLALAPFVSRNTDSARSDIRSVFRRIEATVKLVSKYVQVLHTCSVREGEWAQLQSEANQSTSDKTGNGGMRGVDASLDENSRYSGSRFLWRVIEFVQQIRPYLAQSSFGDIENVPITGQGMIVHSGGSVRMDAAAASQAIRELRLRDLRPDMGMQIVAGTVMCISLAPFHRESDAVGDDSVQDMVRGRMSAFISTVERCVNGTTGVIHSICGDYIIALWNITSSTSSPRVSAVYSALQLVKSAAGPASQQPPSPPACDLAGAVVSIGVAQSFLLAGNIEVGSRKQLSVCGPAVTLAEKLEGCNAAHRTSIMIDQACAEAVATTVIADVDFAIRPVVLLKLREDSDDFTTGFAVHPHRIRQERLKAWNTLFKELGSKLQAGALTEALLEVEEYKNKHQADTSAAQQQATSKQQRGAAGGAGSRNFVDRSAESWKRNISAMMKVKESSQQLATEFGV